MNRLPKEKFLKLHPRCIFCAGRAVSTEPDHQPGRNIFDRRIWLEGYEFPSCAPCHRATKNDELLVDLFARFPSCMASKESLDDMGKRRLPRVLEQFRDLYWNMRIPENQKRRLERSIDRTRLALRFPEEFRYCFNRVAFKLGAALHWKHADHQIIPENGGCMIDIVPNQDEKINREADKFLRRLADQRMDPVANRRSLSDQFEYDFWAREGNAGLYSIRLRKHFRLVISVMMDPSDFAAFGSIREISNKLIGPFDPTKTSAPGYHEHQRPEGIYRWRVLTGLN